MKTPESTQLAQSRLPLTCANCGASLVGMHASRKYCSHRCKVQYRRVSKGHFPPPSYIGDYDKLPDHIKRNFTPGDPAVCWPYEKRGPSGYATNTSVNCYKSQAYRLIYMMMVGPIPEGMDLHHTCDNGPGGCVNWHHLVPVTRQVNMRVSKVVPAALNARKTHCVNGHEFTPENTYERTETTGRGKNGGRGCRQCRRDRLNRARQQDPERIRAYQKKYEQSEKGIAARRERQRRYRERKRGAA